jgi:PPIC-type PPIASE domain
VRFRLPVVTLALALTAASCGVSREVDTAEGPVSAVEVTQGGEATSPPSTPGNDTPTTAAAPVTTAPDDEVAATVVYGDGGQDEVLHGDLNVVSGPTRSNEEFVNLIYQGQVPADFELRLLSQRIWTKMLTHDVAQAGGSISDANRAEAKSLLLEQLKTALTTSTDVDGDAERLYHDVPYLPVFVELQAGQLALAAALEKTTSNTEKFPCASHILVETEAEATQIVADLAGGADFATLAKERSTDLGSGAKGGVLGCTDPAGYVPEFAAAIQGATVGKVVGPVKSQFGYHVLVVTGTGVDPQKMEALAGERFQQSLESATITVDSRLGTWDAAQLRAVPNS